MHRQFLKWFSLATLLSACGEPQLHDAGEPQELGGSKILIVSANENFSLFGALQNTRPTIKSFAMAPNSDQDHVQCIAPNHMTRHGNYLYLTCSLNHEIHMIDAKTLKTVKILPMPKGSNPWSTLIANDDLAFTAGNVSNDIIFFSPRLNLKADETRIKASVNLTHLKYRTDPGQVTLPKPAGLALIDNTLFATITNLNSSFAAGGPGYLVAIDIESGTIKELIQTQGRNPQAVYQGPSTDTERRLYIANSGTYDSHRGGYIGDGSIDVYDIDKHTFIKNIPLPAAPANIAFAFDGIAYVTNGKEGIIFSFDIRTFQTFPGIDLKTVRCENKPDALPSDRLSYISSLLVDKTALYATEFNSSCLIVVNRSSKKVERTFKTGANPQFMIPL